MFSSFPQLIGGATCSGSWLCIDALDRLSHVQTAVITPWIQSLQEVLKANQGSKGRSGSSRKGNANELTLPNSGRLTVAKSAFICFTISPGFPGRVDLQENLMVRIKSDEREPKRLVHHYSYNFFHSLMTKVVARWG